jgi:integrase
VAPRVAVAGVGHVRSHGLRHAHATLMPASGVHPKVISERLAHASVGITLDTYSHVLLACRAAAAEALDAMLAAQVEEVAQ